ncbi:hypothetical protein GCM10025868_07020 [Angustibacter aerolatus]|uniref:GTPase HflX N-terminal domain-containing protein n=1 Tax=Angustibacter aerolatus TaxID=1162965 RepID=A0ABQ6JB98_9ACTN|nr:hypothetical protein [Angustibacter aerolatus]GMA85452.1 hypothetical protein GCM10025868_07020 [Angustibacter aerolatus]
MSRKTGTAQHAVAEVVDAHDLAGGPDTDPFDVPLRAADAAPDVDADETYDGEQARPGGAPRPAPRRRALDRAWPTSPRSSTAGCGWSASCWPASTTGSPPPPSLGMRELAALAETAGSQVLDAMWQRRDQPDASTFLGSGKAREPA